MHKLRYVLLLSFLLALGGTLLANGQEGTAVFDNSGQKSDAKQEKSKTKVKDNSGHRRHWYSPPHWFHRKHDKDSSASKSKTNPFEKPAASGTNQKVASTDSKPVTTGTNQKTVASNTKTTVKPAGKGVTTTNSATKTGGTASTKTVAAHPGTKKGTTARRRRKTVAGTSQRKKTMRQDCTPEQAKKGDCTVDKAHSQKASTNPS
jgi:hypothetical protein